MTILTYAELRATTDALTWEAQLLAAVAAKMGASQLVGYDDFSTPKALIHNAAEARAAFDIIRSNLAGALDPAVLVTLDPAWVDVILGGQYQETRLPALTAQGTLTVAVPLGAAAATYVAGNLLVEDLQTGAYFRNTNAAPVKINAGSSAVVSFEATVAGGAANPLGGATFALVSGPAGASIGVTVSGWTTTRAGRDAESNGFYLQRCTSKWGALGYGGNIDAYNYWIPTSTPAITRWMVRADNPGGPGTIWVYLADSAGPASGGEIASVDAYLQPRKALGSSTLRCFAAAAHTVTITAALDQDGSNPTALAQAASALSDLRSAFPMGGVLDLALIEALLRGVPVFSADVDTVTGTRKLYLSAPGFGGVTGVTLTSPASPVALAANEVLAITAVLS